MWKLILKIQIFKDKLQLLTVSWKKTLLEIVVGKIVSTMFTWIRDMYCEKQIFCIVYFKNVNLEKNE